MIKWPNNRIYFILKVFLGELMNFVNNDKDLYFLYFIIFIIFFYFVEANIWLET